MGIRGLTTYIVRHSDQYLDSYDLHDTYLVIDGNSIASQLYNWHARCHCAFGGDYDKYAECVKKFFDSLIRCKVVPLVLIDGGYENKKVSTVYSRLKSKIRTASYSTPSQKLKFFPLMMKEVFRDVMDETGVKYAQCAFEADDEIAAVARILGCPVLSYDSDFYVYGVLYIPYDSLENGVAKSPTVDGFVKKCKIYRVEKFLNSFEGLDRSMLPLIATLLGNDYINRNVFKQFFRTLKLSKLTKKNSNEQQRRIASLLRWLKTRTLNGAVASVLNRIDSGDRRKVLRKMEAVINGYMNSFPSMLLPLGFSQEYVAEMRAKKVEQTFKFQGELENLNTVEDSRIEEESSGSDNDEVAEEDDDNNADDDEDEEVANESNETLFSTENFLASIAPPWFIEEYSRGQFSSYFIDMMYRQLYFCPPQIEDYDYPAAHMISLKLISVIFELLTSCRKEAVKNLEYVMRDEDKLGVTRYQLESCRQILSLELPSLNELNTLPLSNKTEILTRVLELPKEFIADSVLPEYQLYLSTIVFWAQQGHEPLVTNCHVYSLLCAMLFGVIDQKVGFYRLKSKFEKKYNSQIQKIVEKRKSTPNEVVNFSESTTVDDCLVAAPFFISNFTPDPKTFSNPKLFNVTIVHSFAQFQSCLRHVMHLNSLLGYPYAQTKVAEVYNGTLLYNLYNNFKKRNDIEAYMNVVLKDSPSLLELFNSLSQAIKSPLAKVFQNKVNQKRKRKNRNKPKRLDKNETVSCDSDGGSSEKSPRFMDSNNRFCMLDSME